MPSSTSLNTVEKPSAKPQSNAAARLVPSSSTEGFFQAPPKLLNQFHDDSALQRAMDLFLPHEVREGIKGEMSSFGDKVISPQVLSWTLDAERNTPYVKTFDSWGRRRDELITTEGWRSLQNLGISEGMVSIPYENPYAEYSRVYHFAKYALWAGSAAWVNCPSLMVDGVASLFRKQLTNSNLPSEQRVVLQSAYDRLTSRDVAKAWTTGQWMTERPGGSDVSMTETLATFSPGNVPTNSKANDGNELGPWCIDGFKWFSSATDGNMMVMLARTPKGISTFFAPMRRTLENRDVLGNDTELNGIRIQRLKNKLGTRALPTAELELKGVRAWLIGEEGRGTKEIATVLNIARIHNGVSGIGFWGRGLGIVRAFARVRVVGGRPLWEKTAFMNNLARMHVEYKANVLFNLFIAGLLGVVEQEQISVFNGNPESTRHGLGSIPGLESLSMAEYLLRLLTPGLKGHCSKTAIAGLQECMECLGGVGYLENEDMQFNIARLYRDANILPIWEGTTDMMADDLVLRVLFGKPRVEAMRSFERWVTSTLEQVHKKGGFLQEERAVESWRMEVKDMVNNASREDAELQARAIMGKVVDIVQGLLLLVDALRDRDEVAGAAAKTWFDGKKSQYKPLAADKNWKTQASIDMKLVFGAYSPQLNKARL